MRKRIALVHPYPENHYTVKPMHKSVNIGVAKKGKVVLARTFCDLALQRRNA